MLPFDQSFRSISRLTRSLVQRLALDGPFDDPFDAPLDVSCTRSFDELLRKVVYLARLYAPQLRVGYPRLKSWACQWTPLLPSN